MGQAGSLGGDSLEDVIDERIHDAHGLAGNSSVRVHLLQDFVDVDSVGFPPPPALFLVPSSLGLGLALNAYAPIITVRFSIINNISNVVGDDKT